MELFRPVGLFELERIAASGWRAFPPRLPGQPIFYPVLHREYAERIARDWNVVDEASGFAGFVMRFELPDAFVDRWERQVVGEDCHAELWVPADELDELNAAIVGRIQVVGCYYGERFAGAHGETTGWPRSEWGREDV